jgi:predicted dehydrogenase
LFLKGRRRPVADLLLIGYGERGKQWERALNRNGRFRLAGIVDTDESVRLPPHLGSIRRWQSIGDGIAATEARAAIVASPPEYHECQACECLTTGLTVLVEKPLSTSLASAARVATASESSGRVALVGQNFRFLAREHFVQRALPEIGPLAGGFVSSARPGFVARPHVRASEFGAMWDICLHHFDAIRMRFGAPEKVKGELRSPAGWPGHAAFDVELCWSNGARIRYNHSEGAPGFHHVEYIEGRQGAIKVDDQRVYLAPSGRRPQRLMSARKLRDPHDVILDALAAASLGSKPAQLSAHENLTTIAIAEAVQVAMTEGRPVAIREITERARVGLDEVA